LIKIKHIIGGTVLSDVEIKIGQFTIGRAADNSLQLDDKLVSAHHALFSIKRSKLMESIFDITIEDTNSTNGVFVDGKKIKHIRLKHNDKVSIGHHSFIIYDANADSSSQTEFFIPEA